MVTPMPSAAALGLSLLIASVAGAKADPAPEAPLSRLEVERAPLSHTPVVGEMILATVIGTYDLRITLEELQTPHLPDFDWIQLMPDQWGRERVGGRELVVFRRPIALFPKQPGSRTVDPFVHRLTVVGPRGGRDERPMRSQPFTLRVAPVPEMPGDDAFVARALEATDTWSRDPASLRDGDTVTRTVTLTALGALPSSLPPQPSMQQPWLISFTPPEERSVELTPDGPISTVVWTWHLRPITGEPGVIPARRITWFDTGSREIRQLELAPAPFGYGSFAQNRAAGLARADRAVWPMAGAGLAGVLIGCLVLLPGLRPRTARSLRRGLQRLLPSPHLLAVRRAVRRRDVLELRRTAAVYLAVSGDRDAAASAAMDRLDRHLFAPVSPSEPFNFPAFRRAVAGGRGRKAAER